MTALPTLPPFDRLFWEPSGLLLRFLLASMAFLLASTALRLLSDPAHRLWGQVVASIALLAAFLPLGVVAIVVAHATLLFLVVEYAPTPALRRAGAVVLVGTQVAGAMWWLPHLAAPSAGSREFLAFATNLTFLRAWAWAADRRLLDLDHQAAARDYFLYTFFFPGFVSGPFFPPTEFAERRRTGYWDAGPPRFSLAGHGVAVGRIARGLVLYALALLLASPFLTVERYQAALAGGPGAAWTHAIGVYFAVYLGFSAWTEVCIGLGMLAGVVLPENFNHAHFSYGVAEFWRRWNMSLGHWMHRYVYMPLGGGRPHGWREGTAWLNIVAVFVAVALYHHIGGLKLLGPRIGAIPAFWVPWLAWAAINAAGTIATRRLRPPARWRAADAVLVAATFLLGAVTLQTAFFPILLPIANLWRTWLALVGLA